MKTSKPSPKLSPCAVFRIGLPLHHFCCGAIKGQLRAGEGMWRARLRNRNGYRTIWTGWKAHHEDCPAGHLPFGGGQESVEVGHRLGDSLFFSLTRASTGALGRARGSLSSRRWFASRKRVKQIVGPRIRHDGRGQGENHQHARRPEPDDVMPVPVPGFTGQATVEYQAGFQTAPLPTVRPPEINSGDGEPEKRQVACAGDGLPDGAALAFRSQPTVPIDDFMEQVVRRRQAA